MGFFNFLNKKNKDIITDNGTNYLYYSNGKLKEQFTKNNGVLQGNYFKYDEYGKISTTIYDNGNLVSLEDKLKEQNKELEIDLVKISKIIEIDNLISVVSDGNLIIEMTNNTLHKFSDGLYNIILDYFEEEYIKIYLFYKRNYLISNFFDSPNNEMNLNTIFTDHLASKKNELEYQLKNGYGSKAIRYTYTQNYYYYKNMSSSLRDKLMIVYDKDDLDPYFVWGKKTIDKLNNIINQDCKLLGLKSDGYFEICKLMHSVREEIYNSEYFDIYREEKKYENNIKQIDKIEDNLYKHILSICNTFKCSQDEIKFNLENLNFQNLLKSFEANNLSAIDLFERGIEKIKYKDYLAAIVDFTKAIEIDENYIEAIEKRGDSKAQLKDYEGALEDYNKIIELDKVSKVYYSRGKIKKELLDFDGALQDYNIAIEKYPEDESIFLRRGELKYEMEDYLGAINDISKCIVLKPNLVTYFCQKRGDYKLKIEDYHGAIEDYSIVIDNRQDKYGIDGPPSQNAANILALTYHKRGIARNNIKKYNEAINDFKYAIKLNPSCENDVKIDLEIANKQS